MLHQPHIGAGPTSTSRLAREVLLNRNMALEIMGKATVCPSTS